MVLRWGTPVVCCNMTKGRLVKMVRGMRAAKQKWKAPAMMRVAKRERKATAMLSDTGDVSGPHPKDVHVCINNKPT